MKLTVTDVMGREVAKLADAHFIAGDYSVNWNVAGESSGKYFLHLDVTDAAGSTMYVDTAKLLLMSSGEGRDTENNSARKFPGAKLSMIHGSLKIQSREAGSGGADGTRTRDLLRDRQADTALPVSTSSNLYCFRHLTTTLSHNFEALSNHLSNHLDTHQPSRT